MAAKKAAGGQRRIDFDVDGAIEKMPNIIG